MVKTDEMLKLRMTTNNLACWSSSPPPQMLNENTLNVFEMHSKIAHGMKIMTYKIENAFCSTTLIVCLSLHFIKKIHAPYKTVAIGDPIASISKLLYVIGPTSFKMSIAIKKNISIIYVGKNIPNIYNSICFLYWRLLKLI